MKFQEGEDNICACHLDSSKSNTLFLTINFHVSFNGNIDVLKNSVTWFNSWYLHIILLNQELFERIYFLKQSDRLVTTLYTNVQVGVRRR